MDNLESESITNQPGKHLYGQLMYSTTHNHLKKWRYSDLSRWFISLLHPNSTRACFGSAPVIKIEYFGVSAKILHWYPREDRRPRGRPRRRWSDDIIKAVGATWTRLARERNRWKRMEEAFAQKWAFQLT
ncbi:jg12916 [Pararge aegeria aegeria]|uniref:Jg12916 protein n=1 Tax=Pararge aegeria aegeria TaxID=348720 RepID=A0A8S4S1C2_9NEOP|nr:jg12916 [Pararge aegeria aegeria]